MMLPENELPLFERPAAATGPNPPHPSAALEFYHENMKTDTYRWRCLDYLSLQ